jgi:hypothetical protein
MRKKQLWRTPMTNLYTSKIESRMKITFLALVFLTLFFEEVLGDKLRTKDGRVIEADEITEDADGYWYKTNGMVQFISRSKVKKLERTPVAPTVEKKEVVEEQLPATPAGFMIHMTNNSRMEVDQISETADGIFYNRGALSIFLERSRIKTIEPIRVMAKEATKKKRWNERGWSSGNVRIDSVIRQNGRQYGVDPYLIFLVIQQESSFNPRAVSPVGAGGLMQLMPGTAARFGVRRRFDIGENVRGGTLYLKQLMKKFDGRVDLVLASYNAGEGAVMKYGNRVPPYRETRNYVRKISAKYDSMVKDTTSGEEINELGQ